jgi:nitrogen regulatory protein P-II 1
MKKVEAIIRPDRLQTVQDALDGLGISGLTVTEVVGCGAQRGYTEVYRGARANISLQRKVKVEAVVPDASVDRVVAAVSDAARTGEVGDGKIFILPVDDGIRIRTGERGEGIVQHRVAEHWGH